MLSQSAFGYTELDWLIYADYIDERDESQRAELIRDEITSDSPPWNWEYRFSGVGSVGGGSVGRVGGGGVGGGGIGGIGGVGGGVVVGVGGVSGGVGGVGVAGVSVGG